MIGNLSNAIDVLVHDKSVRAIIVRSMLSDVFCSGADLKERITLTVDELKHYGTSLRALFLSIENLPVPVISAIDGFALGGGLEMALASDIRTVSNDAKLGTFSSSNTAVQFFSFPIENGLFIFFGCVQQD